MAARDYGVIGFSFSGDRAIAKQYAGYARSQMGTQNEYMAFKGLKVHKAQTKLPNGVEIRLVQAAGQKRIFIYAPPGGVPVSPTPGGIVAHPQSAEFDGWGFPWTNGTPTEDGDFQKVIYREGKAIRSNEWHPTLSVNTDLWENSGTVSWRYDMRVGANDWRSSDGSIIISWGPSYLRDGDYSGIGRYRQPKADLANDIRMGGYNITYLPGFDDIIGAAICQSTGQLVVISQEFHSGYDTTTFRAWRRNWRPGSDMWNTNEVSDPDPNGWKNIGDIVVESDVTAEGEYHVAAANSEGTEFAFIWWGSKGEGTGAVDKYYQVSVDSTVGNESITLNTNVEIDWDVELAATTQGINQTQYTESEEEDQSASCCDYRDCENTTVYRTIFTTEVTVKRTKVTPNQTRKKLYAVDYRGDILEPCYLTHETGEDWEETRYRKEVSWLTPYCAAGSGGECYSCGFSGVNHSSDYTRRLTNSFEATSYLTVAGTPYYLTKAVSDMTLTLDQNKTGYTNFLYQKDGGQDYYDFTMRGLDLRIGYIHCRYKKGDLRTTWYNLNDNASGDTATNIFQHEVIDAHYIADFPSIHETAVSADSDTASGSQPATSGSDSITYFYRDHTLECGYDLTACGDITPPCASSCSSTIVTKNTEVAADRSIYDDAFNLEFAWKKYIINNEDTYEWMLNSTMLLPTSGILYQYSEADLDEINPIYTTQLSYNLQGIF